MTAGAAPGRPENRGAENRRDGTRVPSARRQERALLALAVLIGVAAAAMVHAARYRDAAWTPILLIAAALATFFIPHAVLTLRRRAADPVILPSVALLAGIGLAGIYRLDPVLFHRQVIWVGLGQALLIAALLIPDLGRLARYKYLAGTLAVLLLAAAVVFGVEVGGTRQWIRVGTVTFQPSEAVKVLLVIFFAAFLSANEPLLRMPRRPMAARYTGPLLALGGVTLLLLVAQRDLGAGLLLFVVALAVLYAATGRSRDLAAGLALFVVAAAVLGMLFPHVGDRIQAWRDPWSDPGGIGYQVTQALFALGSGGLTGSGPGLGHPDVLPAAATDLIFAALGEELGLGGALAVILLFLLLVGRGIGVARRAGTPFEALLGCGLVAVLGLQAFIIMGGILRLIPLTGVTLPFVSYGGNSMVSSLVLVGLLLRIDPAGPEEREKRAAVGVRRRIGHVGAGLLLLLAGVAAALGWWQGVTGPALAAHPGNPRPLLEARRTLRGTIYDRRLRVLAETVLDGDGLAVRRYPGGADAAHLLGYHSLRYGTAGLEAALDPHLRGQAGGPFLAEVARRLRGERLRGNDLILTIDQDLQRAAARALGARAGAVVALDPRSGAVLASVAHPGFRPDEINEALPALRREDGAPLLDRVTQGRYPPGSAFKVVTMAAGLASGRVDLGDRFTCPGYIYVRRTRVTDFEERAHGTIDFGTALVRSCNVAFIRAGIQIGAGAVRATARALGIGSAPAYDLPTEAGHLPSLAEMAGEGVGQAAFGQGSLAVTPLQMAMVAAAIGARGIAYSPYVVAEIRTPGGDAIARPRPEGRRVLDERIAGQVAEGMREVVRSGTGGAARLARVAVAGKTGTAENPLGRTHAWFIAFAPADAPRVALAVVVEHGGVGGRIAAPIARQVLEAALRQRD